MNIFTKINKSRMSLIKCLSLLAFVFFLISCSDSLPHLTSVTGIVVLDFADEKSFPTERLAVFAETESEIQRVAKITATHESSGLEWVCLAPQKYADGDKKNWVGYTNFVAQEGKNLPVGEYKFLYEDLAGEESELYFNVTYPKGVLEKYSTELPDAIPLSKGEKLSEKIAIYDVEQKLIYWGDRKKSWKKDSDIFNDLGTAQTYRKCYVSQGSSVVYMLPEINLHGEN